MTNSVAKDGYSVGVAFSHRRYGTIETSARPTSTRPSSLRPSSDAPIPITQTTVRTAAAISCGVVRSRSWRVVPNHRLISETVGATNAPRRAGSGPGCRTSLPSSPASRCTTPASCTSTPRPKPPSAPGGHDQGLLVATSAPRTGGRWGRCRPAAGGHTASLSAVVNSTGRRGHRGLGHRSLLLRPDSAICRDRAGGPVRHRGCPRRSSARLDRRRDQKTSPLTQLGVSRFATTGRPGRPLPDL